MKRRTLSTIPSLKPMLAVEYKRVEIGYPWPIIAVFDSREHREANDRTAVRLRGESVGRPPRPALRPSGVQRIFSRQSIDENETCPVWIGDLGEKLGRLSQGVPAFRAPSDRIPEFPKIRPREAAQLPDAISLLRNEIPVPVIDRDARVPREHTIDQRALAR